MITRREKRGSRVSRREVKQESSWIGNIQRKGLVAEYTG